MSDNIKLIIEIPKPMYESVQNGTYCGTLYNELKNGIPLDSVKAEIKENIATRESNKSMVQNVGLYLALEIIDKHIGKAEREEK